MFKTLARYRALYRLLRSRSPSNGAVEPIAANDNRLRVCQSGHDRATLACQWYPIAGGDRLEIRWRLDIETPGIQLLGSTPSRLVRRHTPNLMASLERLS